jgi:hypothetical protein
MRPEPCWLQLSPHPEQSVCVPSGVHALLPQMGSLFGQLGTHVPLVHDSVPPVGAAGHVMQFVPQ